MMAKMVVTIPRKLTAHQAPQQGFSMKDVTSRTQPFCVLGLRPSTGEGWRGRKIIK